MEVSRDHSPAALMWVECCVMSGDGWKAELAVDVLDEAEPDEVAVDCPECWHREFV